MNSRSWFKSVTIISLWLTMALSSWAAVPKAPNPPRLVNDFAHVLNPEQVAHLERILVELDDSTTNQIAVVTLPSLDGEDANTMAYKIGQEWGVGGKKNSNGIVVLVVPKTAENRRGDVAISVGYGLEGAVTDVLTAHIIRDQMIPAFKNNDYYTGIYDALQVLIPAVKGEYDEARTEDDFSMITGLLLMVLVIVIVIIIIRCSSGGKGGRGSGGGGVPFIFFPPMGGGRSSGGGSFGGGSFGGFGGGSFGGGGSSGSW